MAKAKKKSAGAASNAALKRAYGGRFEDVSAAVFVVLAPDGRIVSVNGEAEELTGYERSELEGMCLPYIFREEDRERINSIFDSSVGLEFRKLFEHNVIVRKRSKRKIVVDMGFRRAALAGPALAGAFVFTLQDITDLKTNEERVVRAHEYVNSIIASIVEMLFVVDSNGVVESANDAALELLGYDAGELVGKPVTTVFPTLPTNAEAETFAVGKDDRRVQVLVSRSTLKTPASANGVSTVLVAMDIRERKKAERLIAEQQMTIVQASKLSALGEMASSIAHEINNPLQVVLGRCELLEMQLEGEALNVEQVKAGIAMIDKMSQRINRIVKGLQAHARDQRHDAMEVAMLSDIIRETLTLCEQRIKINVADFQVRLPETPLPIRCRPTQISQVLLNLLNNSFDEVQSMPAPFIHLEASIQEDEIVITVTDSGKGLPREVADKLFTPFFTTKPVGKGTGIGLSISRSLIQAHGGTIELDRSSKRTKFVIRLPLATMPATSKSA